MTAETTEEIKTTEEIETTQEQLKEFNTYQRLHYGLTLNSSNVTKSKIKGTGYESVTITSSMEHCNEILRVARLALVYEEIIIKEDEQKHHLGFCALRGHLEAKLINIDKPEEYPLRYSVDCDACYRNGGNMAQGYGTLLSYAKKMINENIFCITKIDEPEEVLVRQEKNFTENAIKKEYAKKRSAPKSAKPRQMILPAKKGVTNEIIDDEIPNFTSHAKQDEDDL